MSKDSSLGMIAKAFTITGFGIMAASAIALVKTRAIATLQGTEGVGLLGQFTSLQALLGGIAALGLGVGIIKYLSQYLASKEYDKINRSFSSALIMVIFFSAVLASLMALLSTQISRILVGDGSARDYVIMIALSIPLYALSSAYSSFVNGARAIKSLAWISVYSAFGAMATAVTAVYFLGMKGVVVQIAVAPAIALSLNFYYARRVRSGWPPTTVSSRFDSAESRLLLRFGAVSMITGMLLPLTLLATQTAIIHQEGLSANGLFQAAWALFWLYTGFATTSIAVYMLPTMSATKDWQELSRQINNGVRFLALTTTPISCILLLVPGVVLTVAYSSEFTEASWLLRTMVVAGAFRIVSFPLSIALMAKVHLRTYLPIEGSWYVVFAGVVVALLPDLGLEAVAIAIPVAYIVHTVLFVVFAKKTLGLCYSNKNWLMLVSSGAFLVFILGLTMLSPVASYVAAAALLPVWLLYATEKSERRWLISRLSGRSL